MYDLVTVVSKGINGRANGLEAWICRRGCQHSSTSLHKAFSQGDLFWRREEHDYFTLYHKNSHTLYLYLQKYILAHITLHTHTKCIITVNSLELTLAYTANTAVYNYFDMMHAIWHDALAMPWCMCESSTGDGCCGSACSRAGDVMRQQLSSAWNKFGGVTPRSRWGTGPGGLLLLRQAELGGRGVQLLVWAAPRAEGRPELTWRILEYKAQPLPAAAG